jgi:hypothetical protein
MNGQRETGKGTMQLVSCGPSTEHHLEAINRYIEAGYDHIISSRASFARPAVTRGPAR